MTPCARHTGAATSRPPSGRIGFSSRLIFTVEHNTICMSPSTPRLSTATDRSFRGHGHARPGGNVFHQYLLPFAAVKSFLHPVLQNVPAAPAVVRASSGVRRGQIPVRNQRLPSKFTKGSGSEFAPPGRQIPRKKTLSPAPASCRVFPPVAARFADFQGCGSTPLPPRGKDSR